jgi:LmbE family N-acetylglucosaminyl deacetylase
MSTIRHNLSADVVLGVAAHADDLDFAAAGTFARLAAEGAAIYYLIVTDGCKGSADPDSDSKQLAARRRNEQGAAARAVGVCDVFFLQYEDGALEVSQSLKRDIVRFIRRLRPDVVVTYDPRMLYYAPAGIINHPDHRACGQATLDAVYPLARDRMSFPELSAEGLEPHEVRTVLLANCERQEFLVDISDFFERKINAIAAHASQFRDMQTVRKRSESNASSLGHRLGCQYAEGFVRIDVTVS